VDGVAGDADLEHATLRPSVLSASACRSIGARSSTVACDVAGSMYSGGARLENAFVVRAKTERRIFGGISILRLECRPDVERVTLATTRDVRTLVPSELGHAIVARYDRGYVDGYIELTAHLRGGGTWSSGRLPFG
jgi:hypothetical protein